YNDGVVLRQFTRDTNSRHNCMRRFERGNDSFQFGAKGESFECFGVAGADVFGPSAVMKICVLRTDRCVIEASGNRMSRCNLSALILKHVRHGALQNTDASATTCRATVKPCSVFA